MSLALRESSTDALSIAIAVANPDLKQQLTSAMAKSSAANDSGEVFEVAAESADLDALVASIERSRPGILILGLTGLSEDPAIVIGRIAKLQGAPRIVAVSDGAQPETILKAMRAGATEFIYPPFDSGFEEAIARATEHCARRSPDVRAAGKVIGFLSVKGGCGATTVACHSASWLRNFTKKEVLLADLDLSSGVAGLLMQAASRYTLDDALQNLHRLDLKLWKALVASSPSGVDVIAAPAELPVLLPISRKLPHMFRFWRTQYDFTMLDFGHGLSSQLVDTLDSLDTLVLLATNELPALRKAKEIIQALAGRNFGANRLKLVINRMPKRVQIELSELEKLMGHAIYFSLPNDYRSLSEAYSEPRLMDLGSPLGVQIAGFTSKLTGLSGTEQQQKKTFSFLRSAK